MGTGKYAIIATVTDDNGNVNTAENDVFIIENSYGVDYREFTDSRDGRIYISVAIGSQTWMAENLAYLPSVSSRFDQSFVDPMYYVYIYSDTIVSSAKMSL